MNVANLVKTTIPLVTDLPTTIIPTPVGVKFTVEINNKKHSLELATNKEPFFLHSSFSQAKVQVSKLTVDGLTTAILTIINLLELREAQVKSMPVPLVEKQNLLLLEILNKLKETKQPNDVLVLMDKVNTAVEYYENNKVINYLRNSNG